MAKSPVIECPQCHGKGHYTDTDGERIDPCDLCQGWGYFDYGPDELKYNGS